MAETFYISITGLSVRRLWHTPIFWKHAIAAMQQAQTADGCIDAQAKTLHGIHHTRSVWQDRDAMRAYLAAGAHLTAMNVFDRIATGKTLGYEATTIPDWAEVHELWHQQGRSVGRATT